MPTQSAAAAQVFWDPSACPAVLPVHAASEAGEGRGDALEWKGCRAALLLLPEGNGHLLLRTGPRQVQLAMRMAALGDRLRFTVELDQNPVHLRARLAAIETYNRLGEAGLPAQRQCPAVSHRKRLVLVLRALDGWRAGASHHEIAIGLFGERRVASVWRDPGAHLPDLMRRMIGRGRSLMGGGYRRFLT